VYQIHIFSMAADWREIFGFHIMQDFLTDYEKLQILSFVREMLKKKALVLASFCSTMPENRAWATAIAQGYRHEGCDVSFADKDGNRVSLSSNDQEVPGNTRILVGLEHFPRCLTCQQLLKYTTSHNGRECGECNAKRIASDQHMPLAVVPDDMAPHALADYFGLPPGPLVAERKNAPPPPASAGSDSDTDYFDHLHHPPIPSTQPVNPLLEDVSAAPRVRLLPDTRVARLHGIRVSMPRASLDPDPFSDPFADNAPVPLQWVQTGRASWASFSLPSNEQKSEQKQKKMMPDKLPADANPDNKSECVVCKDARANYFPQECAHCCLCFECAEAVCKNKPECPLCRAPFTRIRALRMV
jgi:hypothetical protein